MAAEDGLGTSSRRNRTASLHCWLDARSRTIRLADLLIEVENDLGFSVHLQQPGEKRVDPGEVCALLAAILAHGCNLGLYTMEKVAPDIAYRRLKYVSDWRLVEENQRAALAAIVHGISRLDAAAHWGDGTTSASDGQRFAMPHKVLQRTYSTRFNDFALEFYSFVADNYAPFYSRPIECTDRDAPFVLDGVLYHESDLDLEEHYTDTHGYTEINFAAFGMIGMRFYPRIRSLHRGRALKTEFVLQYMSRTAAAGQDAAGPAQGRAAPRLGAGRLLRAARAHQRPRGLRPDERVLVPDPDSRLHRLLAGPGDLTAGRHAGLPVRPRPAAACQPDRVEERHPLRGTAAGWERRRHTDRRRPPPQPTATATTNRGDTARRGRRDVASANGAAELARVSVWIGEIQWMRRNGYSEAHDPILKPLGTIECRDAIVTPDGTEPEWPAADVVIGNPPFLGTKPMRGVLGDEYTDRMRNVYKGAVPAFADLVCYWFHKAGRGMAAGNVARAGLVATNSIRGGRNRKVLDRVTADAAIFDTWADEPWVVDGAAVRVSLICFASKGQISPRLNGKPASRINPDLTAGHVALTQARRLPENRDTSFIGHAKRGPFDVLTPWMNGMDLTRRSAGKWIIDFGSVMSEVDAALYESPFSHVTEHVRPMRRDNPVRKLREFWWRH